MDPKHDCQSHTFLKFTNFSKTNVKISLTNCINNFTIESWWWPPKLNLPSQPSCPPTKWCLQQASPSFITTGWTTPYFIWHFTFPCPSILGREFSLTQNEIPGLFPDLEEIYFSWSTATMQDGKILNWRPPGSFCRALKQNTSISQCFSPTWSMFGYWRTIREN